MRVKPNKIAAATDALLSIGLNDVERLRLAEMLVGDVLATLAPYTDPVACIAEGKLQVAQDAIESARGSCGDVL